MSAPDPVARVGDCLDGVESHVKAMRVALNRLRAEPSHGRQAAHAVDLIDRSRACVADLFGVATGAAAALYRAQESERGAGPRAEGA